MRVSTMGVTAGLAASLWHPVRMSAAAPVTTACLAADRYTAAEIAAIKGYIHSTDSIVSRFRISVSIPVVADSSIQVESDSTKCARGLATYNEEMDFSTGAATKLSLIRVGTVYVGSNPAFTPNGNDAMTSQIVMDSSFAFKAAYLR